MPHTANRLASAAALMLLLVFTPCSAAAEEIFTDGFTCGTARWPAAAGVEPGGFDPTLIYVLDADYRLSSFDPRNLDDPFSLLGTLSCPASSQPVAGWSSGVTPYSLAVDHHGFAWVLYTSGEIFRVDLRDPALACTATGFTPAQGNGAWKLFSMAFATTAPSTDEERLYVAGGSVDGGPGEQFGVVDPTSLAISTLGNLSDEGEYRPEVSGTGGGELFGFYPGASNAFVQRIDRASGAAVGAATTLDGFGSSLSAWAFAYRGGKLYMFVSTSTGLATDSTVRVVDAATGADEGTLLADLPSVFVAAGVSTCAPTVID